MGIKRSDVQGSRFKVQEKTGMTVDKAVDLVLREYAQACCEHKPFNSAHEGYAVILEELDELKAEVWKRPEKRDINKMRAEAVQVAAMAIRFLTNIYNPEG